MSLEEEINSKKNSDCFSVESLHIVDPRTPSPSRENASPPPP